MATKKLNGVEVEVISTKSGWTSYYDANGVVRKARNSKFEGAAPSKPRKAKPAKAAKKAKGDEVASGHTIGSTPVRKFESYEKTEAASGNASYDTGDKVAKSLRGMTLEEVYTEAARAIKESGDKELGTTIGDIETVLRERYEGLNPGMQRMNLGNRIRGALNAAN